MTPTTDSVGMRIRMLRHQRGLTQEDLALAVGVSRSFIAHWETDRGGEMQYLTRIADILGVQAEVFLHGMATRQSTETVTIDEAELLRLYRGCKVTERIQGLRYLGGLAKAH